jgi:pimeloyl-ACP methyl ester carboxylesterase
MRLAGSLLILALALGAVFVVVAWRADRQAAAAEAAYPPEGQLVEVQGRLVHAVTRGRGPDLVLIHGASGNVRDMTFGFMDRLTDRYRVTAFDRPGHGYSDRLRDDLGGAFVTAGESPMDQAALLRAAAGKLGIERPIVLGHSYGGAVALAWALSDPEETAAVVDVSGVAMPWPGDLSWQYRSNGSALGGALLPPVVAAFPPRWIVDAALVAIFAPNPVPQGYEEHFGVPLTLRAQSLRANARQVNTLRPHVVDMSRHYGSLDLPIEIVHGDADTIVPLSVHSVPLSRLAPGARLVVLPGVGHMPHHSAPEAVMAAIDRARDRAGLGG